MEDYDENDIQESAQDEFEQGQDISDGQLEQYESTYPQAKQEQSKFTWFWKVVGLNKPFRLAKVGNLNSTEIGPHIIPMRDAMRLAHLGHLFHHHKFGNFFATHSKITAASSMAKGGWFMEMSIQEKRIRGREKKGSSSSGEQKWRLFKRNNPQAVNKE
jgi:hypothetical protein